ncbi:MAG: carboxylating nicotinate-nucleotide diphosphorylase [Candidatus Aureabacteria bacterium]|nr:carboxylating nicotinate-nucleotide diphosphorylase [Candidatus Auribacterota bacterium]
MKRSELKKFDPIISFALKEDIGTGDITTNSIVDTKDRTDFVIRLKENAVICGIPIIKEIFKKMNADLRIKHCVKEGEYLRKGSVILKANGKTRAVLTAERTALNFCQRLSGIATLTRKFVQAVKDYETCILDTRKTLPCFRFVEKYAVRVGGGTNHRFGLFDQVLIKENHLYIQAKKGKWSIENAITQARCKNPRKIIEIEVISLKHAIQALDAGADIILLDNMPVKKVKEAMKFLKGNVKVEVSGGINLKTVRQYARAGVDFISIGALTHSVKAMDMTLMLI